MILKFGYFWGVWCGEEGEREFRCLYLLVVWVLGRRIVELIVFYRVLGGCLGRLGYEMELLLWGLVLDMGYGFLSRWL